MTFIPGTNMAQVAVVMTAGGRKFTNNLNFQCDTSITGTNAADLNEYVQAVYAESVSDFISNQVDFTSCTITDLTSDSAPAYEFTSGWGFNGAVGVLSAPLNVAFCLSLRTANRGRSGRGRLFIGGLPNTYIEDNVLSPTIRNGLVAAFETMVTTPLTGWEWVVASRYHNGVARSSILHQNILLVKYTNTVVDTQRRRLP